MASDPRNRSPRPGFVLNVDKQTPPLLFHHGDNFRLEKLPACLLYTSDAADE